MLILSNDDVRQVLTVEDAISAIEQGHAEMARQELVARPRVDIYTETSRPTHFHLWSTMEGSSKALHRHAIRLRSDVATWREHTGGRVEEKYSVRPGLYCGLIMLFDTESGEPLAIMQDGYLQHLRVGAQTSVSVKHLAREDASVVGMIGSGGMARSHLIAFAAVRKIRRVQVYSPNRQHREAYAREVGQQLEIEAVPCESAEEAARGAHIISTCTNTTVPVLHGRMIEPGMHLTQVASEWAADVYPKIDVGIGGDPKSQVFSGLPVDDSRGFTAYLAGSAERLRAAQGQRRGARGNADGEARLLEGYRGRLVPLVDLITGKVPGRLNDQEVSASNGVRSGGGGRQGLQFVTVGSLVYDRARAAGLGKEVPTDWLLQDIRD